MEQEISLRELIETIWKGKWIIAVVTAFCMIVTGIVSFYFMSPVYESEAMLMISPISNTTSENKDENSFFGLVGSLSQYPQMTVDTYKEQIKTPEILSYIREQMSLDALTLSEIENKITVDVIKGTNLITVSVRDNDPAAAAKMANIITEKFSNFVSDTNKKQAENSANFIKKEMENEQKNLDSAMGELKTFLSQPRGPAELKQELDSKLKQLTDFKTDLVQTSIDEKSVQSSLEKSQAILKETPKTLVTNKTLISDELLLAVIKDKTNLNTSDLAGLKLSDEQINGIYMAATQRVNELQVELSSLTAKRVNLENEIANRQKEIESLQAEQADKQQKYDTLNHNVELIRQTYDAYQQKYKEATIKQSVEIGKSSIVVVSQAIEPRRPVAPRKAMNVAIATVLGLMIGGIIVFAKDYWEKSKPTVGVVTQELKG